MGNPFNYESRNDALDTYNQNMEKVVPLALKKMELDMENEKFQMIKTKFINDTAKENELRTRMNAVFAPQEQNVTLPDIQPTKINTTFGGELPTSEGVQGITTKQMVTPQPSVQDLTNILMQYGKDPEKVLGDLIKEQPKNESKVLNPGDVWIDKTGTKLGENTNVKPESTPSWQSSSVTEKGGFPIWKNPKTQATEVVMPNGTRETYDPKKHGKELSQNVSQTTIYNKTGGGGSSLTQDAIKMEGIKYAMTGQMPSMGMGNAGLRSKIINYASAYLIENGINPTEVPAMQAGFKATKDTYANMKKSTEQFGAFEKAMISNMEYATKLSSKYSRTSFPAANTLINAIRTHTGDPEIVEMGTAIYAAAMEFEKIRTAGTAITSAELSMNAQKKAEEIVNKSQTHGQILAVLKAMKTDASNVMDARRKELTILENEMKNNPMVNMGGKPQGGPKATHKYIPGQGIVEIK